MDWIFDCFEPCLEKEEQPAPFTKEEQIPGLIGGAVVYYRSNFLTEEASDHYFDALKPGGTAGIPWERREITVYGRKVSERRDTAFFGDEGTSYKYSGRNNKPLPWLPELAELLELARAATGKPFNFLLCNWYEPKDCIGLHSDDESDLVPGAGIFSVSLGCPRRFDLEPKGAYGRSVSLRLAHGSAIWMAGLCQSAYKHAVPPEKTIKTRPTGRVNLTFRCVRVRQ